MSLWVVDTIVLAKYRFYLLKDFIVLKNQKIIGNIS